MELEVQMALVEGRISLLRKREDYYRKLVRSQAFGKRDRTNWKRNMELLRAASRDLSYLRSYYLHLQSQQINHFIQNLLK